MAWWLGADYPDPQDWITLQFGQGEPYNNFNYGQNNGATAAQQQTLQKQMLAAEAGISFLGLGVQAPGSSIGLMVSDGAQMIQTHPWEPLVPCVVLAVLVLAFSFLGDGIRDAFDPRRKD